MLDVHESLLMSRVNKIKVCVNKGLIRIKSMFKTLRISQYNGKDEVCLRCHVVTRVRGERGGTTGALDQEITERKEGKETTGMLHMRTDALSQCNPHST